MAQNAPVMNVEPIATLLLGWALLDQHLSTPQLIGAAVVVCGIVLLTYRRAH
jgi:drug/metabolite transporter (DMT)-like permease